MISYFTPTGLFSVIFPAGMKLAQLEFCWLLVTDAASRFAHIFSDPREGVAEANGAECLTLMSQGLLLN